MRVFRKDWDYGEFLRVIEEVHLKRPMRVLAYCLMPNHFHLVVWPRPQFFWATNWLMNDVDPDGYPGFLQVASFTQPAHGTVSLDSSGSLVYQPDPGYVGPDSFTYSIRDGSTQP